MNILTQTESDYLFKFRGKTLRSSISESYRPFLCAIFSENLEITNLIKVKGKLFARIHSDKKQKIIKFHSKLIAQVWKLLHKYNTIQTIAVGNLTWQ